MLVQVTNDKKHDCWSTQAFANRRLEFFEVLQKQGLDDALAFALDDRAEDARQAAEVEKAAAATTATAEATKHTDPTVAAAAAIASAAAAAKGPSARPPRPPRELSQEEEVEFKQWNAQLDHEQFWAWLNETDNATHFKSKENLNFWSERPSKYKDYIKLVWVEYGCPGHGKGPWDGLGAMAKTKVTRDITDGNERTPTGRITSPLEVAQHLRAVFCTQEWLAEHRDMKINRVIVMYLDAEQISRPASPPDVSPVKGILSSYSFLFLGTPGHYAMRSYSCWCKACSRVRGRGHGAVSRGPYLDVPGCTRSKLTVWKEDKFTVRPANGQRERDKRTAETLKKELPKAKPGKWGCVQARELWSTEEEVHLRPGHHWLFEFGDAGDGTSCERAFSQLDRRKWEVYKDTRFYDGERALVVKRWLHRVEEDASGLTFEEWDPTKDADAEQPPVAMLVNSSEVRAAGFKLKEVLPLELEAAARSGRRTRGAGLRQLQGMGPTRFVLAVDDDNEFRSRCE